MMCPQQRSFFPCHHSEIWCSQSSNFEFQKMWNQRVKKPFWRHMVRNPKNPSFSHGFLRVFTGFLRVRKTRCFSKTRCFQNSLRVFYGLRRVFYGVPVFSSVGDIFFLKKASNFNVALSKEIHGWLVSMGSFAGRLGCGSKMKLKTIHCDVQR